MPCAGQSQYQLNITDESNWVVLPNVPADNGHTTLIAQCFYGYECNRVVLHYPAGPIHHVYEGPEKLPCQQMDGLSLVAVSTCRRLEVIGQSNPSLVFSFSEDRSPSVGFSPSALRTERFADGMMDC